MSDLIDALTTAITNRPPINEDSDLADILRELVHAAGSAKGAAALVGVKDTTFYRWRNYAEERERGVKQKPSIGRRAMIAACRRAQLKPGLERDLKTQGQTLVITGVMTVSRHTRRQTIHLKNSGDVGRFHEPMPDQAIAEVIDYWLAGDDARADEALREAVDYYYVEGMEIDTVEKIEFE